ncbi:DoxX family protein [Nocardia jinanensis]|uniref:DoxX family protein n=1 Tax=Nocardia jinanensis TaxID=382504 RepID=A0A917RYL7_9NOCA|nr:DoxX family protein [Nocardia jinanensis]GGL46349.1 hypothetical protein GCM10011588_71400 [Nocardia jinanensis]
MLETALWAAQAFLGLFFLAAGLPKVFGRGVDCWVGFDSLARPLVIVIGFSEIAAAVGLVAPMLVDIAGWTTPLAALGIGVVSLMASGFHIRAAGEALNSIECALWAALAGAIAIGRWPEVSDAPAIPDEVLVGSIVAIIPATIAILVVVSKRPIEPSVSEQQRIAPIR